MAEFELELKRAVTVKCVGVLATTALDLSPSTGGVTAEPLMADRKSYRPKSCGHCHDDEKQSCSIPTKCL